MDNAPLSPAQLAAVRVWVQGRRIYVELESGRTVSFPTSKYAVLDRATQTDLESIQLIANRTALTWAALDEEISIEDVAATRFVHTPRSSPVAAAK